MSRITSAFGQRIGVAVCALVLSLMVFPPAGMAMEFHESSDTAVENSASDTNQTASQDTKSAEAEQKYIEEEMVPPSEPAVMPNLVGMNYADAKEMIKHFDIKSVTTLQHEGNADKPFGMFGVLNPHNWVVYSQDFEPGECIIVPVDLTLSLVRVNIGFDGMDFSEILRILGMY